MKEKIIELRNQGKSYGKISTILNCSKSTISYYLNPTVKDRIINYTKRRRTNDKIATKLGNFNYCILNKIKEYNRRHDIKGAKIGELRKIIESNPTCYLTGDKIDFSDTKSYNFDHKIPISRGGDSSLQNLGICTAEVNRAKMDKTPEEFLALCIKVLRWNGYSVVKSSIPPRT